MLQPVDDSTESLPDEPAPPQPQQQLPAGPASALTANTGLHTGTKSHEDVRRLIAAASSSALLEKDAEATPTFPNAESVGSAIEFQTTENDGDDGGCVMATGLVESGDESASVEASTPSRRESRARRESGANPSELAAILEKSQEMAPGGDGLVGESSEQEIDAPVVVPSPRNLSVDSKESSVLTSVTPTTPPLASYSSSHYAHVTPNEATNDSVPNLQVQSTIGEVDIQSEHSDDILESDAVKSITKEVQESGQDFLRKRTVEEPVKEVKNLPSESPEKLSPCHSQSGMNLGTAAAIGGAVAGLSAFLYLKLK